MRFWKASIDKTNSIKSKVLSSISMRASDGRLVVRMNMDDNTFFDIECNNLPNFKNGDVLHLYISEKIEIPCRNDEQKEEC